MSEEKAKKKVDGKKVAIIIFNVIFYVIIALIFASAVWGLVCKFTGEDTYSFFGFKLYRVATPSMSRVNEEYSEFLEGHTEQMQVGDLILIRNLKEDENPKVYDIVTFRMGGKTIVHRVVNIDDEGVWYTTRGDANNNTDGERTREEFTGTYVANLGGFAGDLVGFVQSWYGVAAMAGCGFVIFAVLFVLELLRRKEKAKEALEDTKDTSAEDKSEDNATQEKAEKEEDKEEDTPLAEDKTTEEKGETDLPIAIDSADTPKRIKKIVGKKEIK